MLCVVSLLACLVALEAGSVPHLQSKTDMVPAVPALPKTRVAVEEKKAASEAKIIILPLKNYIVNGQQSFVGQITVGTPGQPMSVVVDITSSLTYVPSVNCTDSFCTSHRQYDSSVSSTYVEDGRMFELPAGQNASGVISQDAVSVEGVAVEDQKFGEATAVWNQLTLESPNDGVLGVGFYGTVPPLYIGSLLDGMAFYGLIEQAVAGLWLGRNPLGGEMTMGGVNEERYRGELTWAYLLFNPESWFVMANGTTVGKTSFCSGYCYISASTTSPFFYLSMETAKAVNDALGGTDSDQPGVAVLECSTLYTLPNLKIDVAGRILEMSPLEYTFVLDLGGGAEVCISGFVGTPEVRENFMTVGTLFMQKFYTVYDMVHSRWGFADSA